jgi:hypothetical protein
MFEYHINAFLVGQTASFRFKAFLAVINNVIGSKLQSFFALFIRADRYSARSWYRCS